ncbi:EF-hand calcium-binding domain-containing protein 11-like [Plakobranchus ocellatus]|uniref:EF-hand calcium-binding domain-containing protein 11-like n=1 Tax=Plakobranchus ocellatus TaxID=259542 RepID=A0AAV4DVV3_9GAST|nr:EF-hand calcium-binding domain-containing protein 11-like [Plakobranchus ocellatus]
MEIFQECDEDGKKYLRKDDIKVAVMMLFGHKISKDEVLQMLSDHGSYQECGEKGLNLAQFRAAMKPKFDAVDEDEQIRHTFLAFDRTCRGFLTMDDVKAVFRQVCPHFAEHRVELAFKELDRDGDGRVSYKDFDFLMKFNYTD